MTIAPSARSSAASLATPPDHPGLRPLRDPYAVELDDGDDGREG